MYIVINSTNHLLTLYMLNLWTAIDMYWLLLFYDKINKTSDNAKGKFKYLPW